MAKGGSYPLLEKAIRKNYAEGAGAVNKNSLYDSYIKAFRWATDRIGEEGIVAYISNGGWLDAAAMAGFRASLQKEFAEIYVFNLRGNCRTSGDLRRREGDGVFGLGSRTPITITILIKNKKTSGGQGVIHYHDIGDYLSREEKLKIVEEFHDVTRVPWSILSPDKHNDWINQRNGEFDAYVPLAPEKKFDGASQAFFTTYSNGVKTGADATFICFSSKQLSFQSKTMDVVFDKNLIASCFYRPFCSQYLYYQPKILQRPYRIPSIFPSSGQKNLVICVSGVGVTKAFSCIITDKIPDLELIGKSQCFPLYWYEEIDTNGGQFMLPGLEQGGHFIRHDGVSDFIQWEFEKVLGTGIPKEDIFYWVYGALHSPRYRTAFEADLKKQLPRLPLPEDRPAYERVLQIGRELARLHLHYEEVEPWPLEKVAAPGTKVSWRVEKLRFGKKKGGAEDRSVIVVNPTLRLEGIPEDAYGYVVNGRSAIEWIMDRYQVRRDADSGIVNDPNKWGKEHGNERYIVDLIARVVRVGMESVRLVAQIDG